MPDDPSTPTRDQHDNSEFSPDVSIGEGYPEEEPKGSNPDGESDNPTSQPQRREGTGAEDGGNR